MGIWFEEFVAFVFNLIVFNVIVLAFARCPNHYTILLCCILFYSVSFNYVSFSSVSFNSV